MLLPPSAGRIANDLVSVKPPAPRPPRRSEPWRVPRQSLSLSLVPPFKLLRVRGRRIPTR